MANRFKTYSARGKKERKESNIQVKTESLGNLVKNSMLNVPLNRIPYSTLLQLLPSTAWAKTHDNSRCCRQFCLSFCGCFLSLFFSAVSLYVFVSLCSHSCLVKFSLSTPILCGVSQVEQLCSKAFFLVIHDNDSPVVRKWQRNNGVSCKLSGTPTFAGEGCKKWQMKNIAFHAHCSIS